MVYERFSAHSARSGQRQHRANWTCGDSDVDWGDSTSGVAEAEDSDEDDGGMLWARTLRLMRWLRSYGVWASPGKHMSARVTWKTRRGSAWRTRMRTMRRTRVQVAAMAKRSTQSWSWPMPCRRS